MITARKLCGLPKYIRAERVSPFPFRSTDIGVVHDLLIHDIDLVLDLVRSDVETVQAFGASLMSPLEDMINARLTFRSGCIVDLTASRIHRLPICLPQGGPGARGGSKGGAQDPWAHFGTPAGAQSSSRGPNVRPKIIC